jgi:hypothetical protein
MLSSDRWEMFKYDAFDRLQPKSVPQVGSHQSNWAAQHSGPGAVAHSSFTIRATTVMASENSGGNPAPTQIPRGKQGHLRSLFSLPWPSKPFLSF